MDALTDWFAAHFPDSHSVRIEGLDRVEFGHSAETLLLTLVRTDDDGEHRQDVVVRLRPPSPGLLEPYDIRRQFEVLRALEPTPVRSPRVFWHEATGEVLGREFYVMERLDGTVYEQVDRTKVDLSPEQVRQMCGSMIEQIAAVHQVDPTAAGLGSLGDGADYVERELDHWASEIRRVQRGPLPALERLVAELRATMPSERSRPTLVHGDAKPGNYGFVDHEVRVVYDWEMATIGEPMTDIGWAELTWSMPGSMLSLPGALTPDEMIERYAQLTGVTPRDRHWYRAFQCLKMTTIMLVAGSMFESGQTDDLRFAMMGYGVGFTTPKGLAELGIHDPIETGPAEPSAERMAVAQQRAATASSEA